MRQKKSRLWIITCLIICTMALFGLTACGNSGGGQAADETTAAEETTAGEMISESEALENATAGAGCYVDDVDDIEVTLNQSDGETGYDVTFRQDGILYEYYVDAYTGEVYEYE